MQTITQQEAATLINNSKGKFFTVRFEKRTNQQLRTMTARTGVRKHTRGGSLAFDPASRGLIGVFELGNNQDPKTGQFTGHTEGYKFIPIDGILQLKIGGKQYDVTD